MGEQADEKRDREDELRDFPPSEEGGEIMEFLEAIERRIVEISGLHGFTNMPRMDPGSNVYPLHILEMQVRTRRRARELKDHGDMPEIGRELK
jgi:hypothetical protein